MVRIKIRQRRDCRMEPLGGVSRRAPYKADDFALSGARERTGKKRIVVAYICLVGVPLLALVGILDAGRGLRAPIAVGGTWDIQADLQRLASASCASLAVSQQPVLVISQSGRYLALTLDRMQGSGRVENTTVSAIVSPPANDASCGPGERRFYLQANRSADRDLMTGVIGLNGCPDEVPFRAIHRDPSASVGP